MGRVADVATKLRDDFVAGVVAVLPHEGQAGQTCDLTGPEAFTVTQAAAMRSLEARRPQSDNPWLTFE